MNDQSQADLYLIGDGRCGSVWAPRISFPGTPAIVIKRDERNEKDSTLWNEYWINGIVQRALSTRLAAFAMNFRIPVCYEFVHSQASAWGSVLPRLPRAFGNQACQAIICEKITPISKYGREKLIRRYCSARHLLAYLRDKKNEHCLVRPYLGRRKESRIQDQGAPLTIAFFSLRNLPLSVNQLEELGLDTEYFAKVMAEALAFFYWCAQIDANSIEFVLAGQGLNSPYDERRPETRVLEHESLGPYTIWVLDFDRCGNITLDENGIDLAAKAFWRNDPYYPRPAGESVEDRRLWKIFQEHFLDVSGEILKDHDKSVRQLPKSLMQLIGWTKDTYGRGNFDTK